MNKLTTTHNNKKQKGRFTISKMNNGPHNGEKTVTIERNIKLITQINQLRNENLRLKRNLCKIRALLIDVTC